MIDNNSFFINWNNWISVLVENVSQEKFYNSKECYKYSIFITNLDNISTFRWRILSTSISIENLINYILEFIIFDEKNNSSELFQKYFLRTSNITFFSKWNILKELCKNNEKTKKYYDKEIIRSIQNAIEIRNIIAHWYIIYNFENKCFYIEYIKSGKIVKEEINNDYIEKNSKLVYNCINNINKLIYWYDTTIKKNINNK